LKYKYASHNVNYMYYHFISCTECSLHCCYVKFLPW